MALDGAQGGRRGTMCGVGGRVREGNPPKLWSNLVQDPRDAGHRGGGLIQTLRAFRQAHFGRVDAKMAGGLEAKRG